MKIARLLPYPLSVVLVLMLIRPEGPAHAQPTSGDWKAATAFGELAFTVNPAGTLITKLIRDVKNWACGPVSGSWTTTTYFTDPTKGWPITDNQFAITLSGSMGSLTNQWVVNGAFGNSGKNASGTWSFTVSGTVCSGEWGPVSAVVSVAEQSEFPGAFVLHQNYPNPFNPTTTIEYGLPVRSFVRVIVYNAMGQTVRELVNGEIAAGYHSAEFDGSGLASGVYFYRMHAADFVQTRRLLLLR